MTMLPLTLVLLSAPAPAQLDASNGWTASAVIQGTLLAARAEGGLFRWEEGRWVQVELPLEGAQARIHGIAATSEDLLWLGTEGGLLQVHVTSCGVRIEPIVTDRILSLQPIPNGVRALTQRGWREHTVALAVPTSEVSQAVQSYVRVGTW